MDISCPMIALEVVLQDLSMSRIGVMLSSVKKSVMKAPMESALFTLSTMPSTFFKTAVSMRSICRV